MRRAASTGTSGSSSESESSALEIQNDLSMHQTGSRKRRKLSHSASEDESGSETPAAPVQTLSRIKAKKTGLLTKDDGVPDSISAVLSGHETTSFASLNVSPWLIASLSAMAIKRPTGIQRSCIPEILKGRDWYVRMRFRRQSSWTDSYCSIGGSRTGTGKTVAFAVPILQKWAEDPVGIFAVVITPTR